MSSFDHSQPSVQWNWLKHLKSFNQPQPNIQFVHPWFQWIYQLPLDTGAGSGRDGEKGKHVVTELVWVEDVLITQLRTRLAVQSLERDTFKVLGTNNPSSICLKSNRNSGMRVFKRQMTCDGNVPCANGCVSRGQTFDPWRCCSVGIDVPSTWVWASSCKRLVSTRKQRNRQGRMRL